MRKCERNRLLHTDTEIYRSYGLPILGSQTTHETMLVQENERAAAALDVAQEQLQALCQAHAGTFVAVEGRTKEIRS